MRAKWLGCAAVICGALGCATSRGPDLKTPIPEQYSLPPADDSRFTQPVSYPKDVLNQDTIKPAAGGKLPSQQAPMPSPGGMGRGAPGGF
jgi:hypothetical protein